MREKAGASEIVEVRTSRMPLSHEDWLIASVGATYPITGTAPMDPCHLFCLVWQRARVCLLGFLANTCACSAHAITHLLAEMQAGFAWNWGSSMSQPHKTQICTWGNSLNCFKWRLRAVPSSFPLQDHPLRLHYSMSLSWSPLTQLLWVLSWETLEWFWAFMLWWIHI